MNELISVIIPSYNAGEYLNNCLNSVFFQTYDNLEVILVNDGSTDNTKEIANQFMQQYPDRFKAIHTKNQGVAAARMEGLRLAAGEWIGFVDADDEIEPDMYERLYQNAVNYDADISHCGYKTIVDGGKRIHEFYNTGRFAVQDRQQALKDLLEVRFEPSLCNKLFRHSLFDGLLSGSTIDLSIRYNEDLLMNYYLFKEAHTSVFEDFCGYHYLARSTSATRKGFRIEKRMDPVRVRKQILDDVEPELHNTAMRNYLAVCSNSYSVLAEKKEYESYAKEIKGILINNKSEWHLLSRNDYIKLRLMLFSTKLFNRLYGFYEKHFQKKIYE